MVSLATRFTATAAAVIVPLSGRAKPRLTIVRTCRSKAVAQEVHLRPEIELSGGSLHIETIVAQSLLWPSLQCISDSVDSSLVEYHLQHLLIFKGK
jgi:hypothetical protein